MDVIDEVEAERIKKPLSIRDHEKAFVKAWSEFPQIQTLAGPELMEKFCGRVIGILYLDPSEEVQHG